MHKLLILILPTGDPGFDDLWPGFLHAAERIPGLRREATSRVSQLLFGDLRCQMIHELFFDTLADLENGLDSPEGQHAGLLLQQITGGRMVLLLAEHTEDDIEHLRQFQGASGTGEA